MELRDREEVTLQACEVGDVVVDAGGDHWVRVKGGVVVYHIGPGSYPKEPTFWPEQELQAADDEHGPFARLLPFGFEP